MSCCGGIGQGGCCNDELCEEETVNENVPEEVLMSGLPLPDGEGPVVAGAALGGDFAAGQRTVSNLFWQYGGGAFAPSPYYMVGSFASVE